MERINIQSINERNVASYLDNNIALLTQLSDIRNFEFNEVLVEGFIFALILKGNVRLSIDDETYELHEGDLFICNPKNIMEKSMMSMDLDVRAIFITPEFAEKTARNINLDWTHRLMALSHEQLHASAEAVERFMAYFLLLQKKLEAPESPNKLRSIFSLMESMAFDMFDLRRTDAPNAALSKYSSAENLMQRFLAMLEADDTPPLNVNGYAESLNVTPKYFSTVCKKMTGMTAGQIINEKTIREAKNMLRDNSYSIKQIASRLGFANQSHFGSYFRRYVGMSPQQYRRR
ncbi:MAG: AraC family transcriptional regulator [Prevotella sp.]|nr:AraC family transcriptional regulator [Prevotella sp.]